MHSLGTPLLADTPTTDALVGCGSQALGILEVALSDGEPRVAMYAAYCLGRIGDPRAVATLSAVLTRYKQKVPRQPFDFGVISAATQAIQRLGGAMP